MTYLLKLDTVQGEPIEHTKPELNGYKLNNRALEEKYYPSSEKIADGIVSDAVFFTHHSMYEDLLELCDGLRTKTPEEAGKGLESCWTELRDLYTGVGLPKNVIKAELLQGSGTSTFTVKPGEEVKVKYTYLSDGSWWVGPSEYPVPKTTASKDDGWIKWTGGKCPVEENVFVNVRFASGLERNGFRADYWDWGRDPINGYDIIAYKVIK